MRYLKIFFLILFFISVPWTGANATDVNMTAAVPENPINTPPSAATTTTVSIREGGGVFVSTGVINVVIPHVSPTAKEPIVVKTGNYILNDTSHSFSLIIDEKTGNSGAYINVPIMTDKSGIIFFNVDGKNRASIYIPSDLGIEGKNVSLFIKKVDKNYSLLPKADPGYSIAGDMAYSLQIIRDGTIVDRLDKPIFVTLNFDASLFGKGSAFPVFAKNSLLPWQEIEGFVSNEKAGTATFGLRQSSFIAVMGRGAAIRDIERVPAELFEAAIEPPPFGEDQPTIRPKPTPVSPVPPAGGLVASYPWLILLIIIIIFIVISVYIIL